MKFALISNHAGGKEIPQNEKETHLKEFGEWLTMMHPIVALPLHSGVTITAEVTESYTGGISGVLIFETTSLDEAVEKVKKSPGLKYGWTHEVLLEMPM